MGLSKESIDEFKVIYKNKFKKELSDAEASEAANNLIGLFKILYDCEVKDLQRKHRLKKKPEGFHLDGEYTCSICHRQVAKGESWYDKWGIKCPLCRKAVKEGSVPPFICKDRDSWYAMWELDKKFKIKHPTARKLVRQGKLKARIVANENGDPYEYIFLKKENPDLIDPERKSPARKSYDRNYNKVMDARIREEKRNQKRTVKSFLNFRINFNYSKVNSSRRTILNLCVRNSIIFGRASNISLGLFSSSSSLWLPSCKRTIEL